MSKRSPKTASSIRSFKITKLFGLHTYELQFTDNKLILVGENGCGKTTVLTLFYGFMTGNYDKLSKYKFEKIEVTFTDELHGSQGEVHRTRSVNISKNDLDQAEKDIARILLSPEALSELPPPIRRYIMGQEDTDFDIEGLKLRCRRYGIPWRNVETLITKARRKHNKLTSAPLWPDVQFLFLPTYRRVERRLQDVLLDGRDESYEDWRYSSKRYDRVPSDLLDELENKRPNENEIFAFGMQDIQKRWMKFKKELDGIVQQALKEQSTSLVENIATGRYKEITLEHMKELDEATVERIVQRFVATLSSESEQAELLPRLQERMVELRKKQSEKDPLSELDQLSIAQLLVIKKNHDNILKEEEKMTTFMNIVNQYLEGKELRFKEDDFGTLEIRDIEGKQSLSLEDLSSGEKQLISMFDYFCFTTKQQPLFVIIDEPELSLSMEWQKRLLEDLAQLPNVVGLFATTHSPFIFDNTLSKYALGMGQCLVEG